jgi:hypothetical protein
MSEEKPLFQVDIEQALEGLLGSIPERGQDSIKLDRMVMHSVDLANALDGAGLDDLSGHTSQFAELLRNNQRAAIGLAARLAELVTMEIRVSIENDADAHQAAALAQAKKLFEQELQAIRNRAAGVNPAVTNHAPAAPAQATPSPATIARPQASAAVSTPVSTPVSNAPAVVAASASQTLADGAIYDKDNKTIVDANSTAVLSPSEPLQSEPLDDVDLLVEEVKRVQQHAAQVLNPSVSPAMVQALAQDELRSELDQALDQDTVTELDAFLAPFRTNVNEIAASMPPAELENVPARIDREQSLDYSSEAKYLDKQFVLNRTVSLNRLQNIRTLAAKYSGWNKGEIDHLLNLEQNELLRVGQQSLRHTFENLTEALLIDEVYVDPAIAQQLLTILSILPPAPSIFAVQQDQMVFIDLDDLTLADEHLLAASHMMAEIAGTVEVQAKGIRLTCPTSLLRMTMAVFTRHGERYAVSALQYLGEEATERGTDSKNDGLGQIIQPARRLYLRAGNRDFSVYAHEFLGMATMNVHQDLPVSLERPHWFGGTAIDGQNLVHAWVALDRHTR